MIVQVIAPATGAGAKLQENCRKTAAEMVVGLSYGLQIAAGVRFRFRSEFAFRKARRVVED